MNVRMNNSNYSDIDVSNYDNDKYLDCYENEQYDFGKNEDELTNEEIDLIHKWEEIRHFTMEDYVSCKETREILIHEWEDKFNNTLEKNILDIFNNHYNNLKEEYSNVLYRCEERHGIDLVSIVRHHLVKKYSLDIFKKNPYLAEPILKKLNDLEYGV